VAPEKASRTPNLPVLKGRVLDKTTGQPIPLVEVGLQPFPAARRFTFTDSEGYFNFVNPPVAYQLEAGSERWTIGYSREVTGSNIRPPKVDFELMLPGTASVKSKDGQSLEGEPAFHAIAVRAFVSKGKPFSPNDIEMRRFPYSTSILELRAANLAPGNETGFPKYSYSKDH
jgi:hypothetical protein